MAVLGSHVARHGEGRRWAVCLTGVRVSVPFQARMWVQGSACAHVELTRTQTMVAQGWGALQRFRHGGSTVCVAARCRREVFRARMRITGYDI